VISWISTPPIPYNNNKERNTREEDDSRIEISHATDQPRSDEFQMPEKDMTDLIHTLKDQVEGFTVGSFMSGWSACRVV
jgi:hypothetical protein